MSRFAHRQSRTRAHNERKHTRGQTREHALTRTHTHVHGCMHIHTYTRAHTCILIVGRITKKLSEWKNINLKYEGSLKTFSLRVDEKHYSNEKDVLKHLNEVGCLKTSKRGYSTIHRSREGKAGCWRRTGGYSADGWF